MRYLQTLGAAIAVAALTAIIGAGTASATKLCENNQTSGCTSATVSGSSFKFTAEDSVKWTGPFGIPINTCTSSTMEGSTTSSGGGAGVSVTGNLTVLTFSSCSHPTTVQTGGTLSIASISGTDNGSITSSGTTVTIHEIPNIIGNPPTCSYVTSGSSIGPLTGSLTAPTIDVQVSLNAGIMGCPIVTWEGHYKYTGSTPSIVSAS
jgi:hypothetical protein